MVCPGWLTATYSERMHSIFVIPEAGILQHCANHRFALFMQRSLSAGQRAGPARSLQPLHTAPAERGSCPAEPSQRVHAHAACRARHTHNKQQRWP